MGKEYELLRGESDRGKKLLMDELLLFRSGKCLRFDVGFESRGSFRGMLVFVTKIPFSIWRGDSFMF